MSTFECYALMRRMDEIRTFWLKLLKCHPSKFAGGMEDRHYQVMKLLNEHAVTLAKFMQITPRPPIHILDWYSEHAHVSRRHPFLRTSRTGFVALA